MNKVTVTGVKDQLHCGSCWSFSGTGAIEAAICMTDDSVDCTTWEGISEQQIISCANENNTDIYPYYNYGCGGGWKDRAMYYVMVTGGDQTEASYPYLSGEDGDSRFDTCHFDSTNNDA